MVLVRQPNIVAACVVPVAGEINGSKPMTFVQLRVHKQLSEQAVRNHALAHAPAYLHPRRVWFLDRLPLGTCRSAHVSGQVRQFSFTMLRP